MTDMIERVARALKRVINERCGLPDDEPWELYKDEAIAAIKAMREPSKDMISAVREIGGPQAAAYAIAAWPTMIDAALKGTGQ